MFITRKALPRRTFLRGVGRRSRCRCWMRWCRLCRQAAEPTPRLGFIYVSNGVIQKQWNPATGAAIRSCRRS